LFHHYRSIYLVALWTLALTSTTVDALKKNARMLEEIVGRVALQQIRNLKTYFLPKKLEDLTFTNVKL
jgi:hypothetical protein